MIAFFARVNRTLVGATVTHRVVAMHTVSVPTPSAPIGDRFDIKVISSLSSHQHSLRDPDANGNRIPHTLSVGAADRAWFVLRINSTIRADASVSYSTWPLTVTPYDDMTLVVPPVAAVVGMLALQAAGTGPTATSAIRPLDAALFLENVPVAQYLPAYAASPHSVLPTSSTSALPLVDMTAASDGLGGILVGGRLLVTERVGGHGAPAGPSFITTVEGTTTVAPYVATCVVLRIASPQWWATRGVAVPGRWGAPLVPSASGLPSATVGVPTPPNPFGAVEAGGLLLYARTHAPCARVAVTDAYGTTAADTTLVVRGGNMPRMSPGSSGSGAAAVGIGSGRRVLAPRVPNLGAVNGGAAGWAGVGAEWTTARVGNLGKEGGHAWIVYITRAAAGATFDDDPTSPIVTLPEALPADGPLNVAEPFHAAVAVRFAVADGTAVASIPIGSAGGQYNRGDAAVPSSQQLYGFGDAGLLAASDRVGGVVVALTVPPGGVLDRRKPSHMPVGRAGGGLYNLASLPAKESIATVWHAVVGAPMDPHTGAGWSADGTGADPVASGLPPRTTGWGAVWFVRCDDFLSGTAAAQTDPTVRQATAMSALATNLDGHTDTLRLHAAFTADISVAPAGTGACTYKLFNGMPDASAPPSAADDVSALDFRPSLAPISATVSHVGAAPVTRGVLPRLIADAIPPLPFASMRDLPSMMDGAAPGGAAGALAKALCSSSFAQSDAAMRSSITNADRACVEDYSDVRDHLTRVNCCRSLRFTNHRFVKRASNGYTILAVDAPPTDLFALHDQVGPVNVTTVLLVPGSFELVIANASIVIAPGGRPEVRVHNSYNSMRTISVSDQLLPGVLQPYRDYVPLGERVLGVRRSRVPGLGHIVYVEVASESWPAGLWVIDVSNGLRIPQPAQVAYRMGSVTRKVQWAHTHDFALSTSDPTVDTGAVRVYAHCIRNVVATTEMSYVTQWYTDIAAHTMTVGIVSRPPLIVAATHAVRSSVSASSVGAIANSGLHVSPINASAAPLGPFIDPCPIRDETEGPTDFLAFAAGNGIPPAAARGVSSMATVVDPTDPANPVEYLYMLGYDRIYTLDPTSGDVIEHVTATELTQRSLARPPAGAMVGGREITCVHAAYCYTAWLGATLIIGGVTYAPVTIVELRRDGDNTGPTRGQWYVAQHMGVAWPVGLPGVATPQLFKTFVGDYAASYATAIAASSANEVLDLPAGLPFKMVIAGQHLLLVGEAGVVALDR